MKQFGEMWCLDDDEYFERFFQQTGDQFEIENLYAALAFTKSRRVAIDGGAHYGSWTRYLSREFQVVHAFEPCVPIFECLQRNTEHLTNVVLHNEALGNSNQKVTIVYPENVDNTGCGMVEEGGNILMNKIDDYSLGNVDFIKLDLEGFEYETLLGAERTLIRCMPVIIFEDKGFGNRFSSTELNNAHTFLESIGAFQLGVVRKRDYIYGWKETSLRKRLEVK